MNKLKKFKKWICPIVLVIVIVIVFIFCKCDWTITHNEDCDTDTIELVVPETEKPVEATIPKNDSVN